MTSAWQRFEEPLGQTLFRTVLIAWVVGGAIALRSHRWLVWPLATLLVLWPSFGGHWVEVWFLNWVRPRVSPSAAVQMAARILVWMLGGSVLGLGMALTARCFFPWRSPHWLHWWVPGAAFIALELVMHLLLQLRGRPSFYNGRG